MNKNIFIENVEALGIKLNDKMLERLDIYASYLREYNEHTNLTAITDEEGIYLKHFYDSLTIVKDINLLDVKTLVDVGSGAGFPGMVLKIVFPHLKVILIDSNNKKITFLNNLIKLLQLEDIEAINTRSEEFALKHKDEYDIVTARAVSALPILTELCLPMVKVGGYFIAMKGNALEEIDESENIIKTLKGQIESVTTFNIPIEEAKRTLIKIKKNGVTPPNYPRRYDKIKKALKKHSK